MSPSILAVPVAVLLCAAAALAVLRMLLGPSVLDRVVATDMLLAVIVCGLGAVAAFSGDSSVVPVLVVVALLGFVGSVSVARFLGRETQ